jgi:hypothetical protein
MYLSITVVEIETKDKGIAGECQIFVMMFFLHNKNKNLIVAKPKVCLRFVF